MAKIAMLLLLWAACAGCTASGPYGGNRVRGTFEGDRYFDPSGTFSVKCLQSSFNPLTTEVLNEKGVTAGVIFQDDIGQMIRFERVAGVKEIATQVLSEEDALNCTFEFTYDEIRALCPGTKVVAKQKVEIEPFGAAYAGVLDMPRGSTLMDATSGVRNDARRSIAFAFSDSDLLIASVQENDLLRNLRLISCVEPSEGENIALMEEALEVLKSYSQGRSLKSDNG